MFIEKPSERGWGLNPAAVGMWSQGRTKEVLGNYLVTAKEEAVVFVTRWEGIAGLEWL